jgi:phage repressor protein C with HTH and peptisase S24 domain
MDISFDRLSIACSVRYGSLSKASTQMGKSMGYLSSYRSKNMGRATLSIIKEELHINLDFLKTGTLPIYTDGWTSTELKIEEVFIRLRDLAESEGREYEEYLEYIGTAEEQIRIWASSPGHHEPIGERLRKAGVDTDRLLGKESIGGSSPQEVVRFNKPDPFREEFADVAFVDNPADLGTGQFVFEEKVSTIPLSTYMLKALKLKKPFLMPTKGESMRPKIYDGDIVIVEREFTPTNGDILVCRHNGDILCKTYWVNNGMVILSSFNATEFAPIVVSDEDDFVILGKVVKAIKPLGKWKIKNDE